MNETTDEKPDSHWNHRVMRKEHDNSESTYGIHEVYYKQGKANMWTEDPVEVTGDDVQELKQTLERMLLALEKPILNFKDGSVVD
jgi:hypothetical protein